MDCDSESIPVPDRVVTPPGCVAVSQADLDERNFVNEEIKPFSCLEFLQTL